MLNIQIFPVGMLGTNAYVVTDAATGETAVIDPGFDQPDFAAAVAQAGNVTKILLTHGHYDHIGGVAALQRRTGAKIYLYKDEAEFPQNSSLNLDRQLGGRVTPFTADVLLSDGDTFALGESQFTVLHTPGHTEGSCCFLSGDSLFTGDTLFCGSMGRTDFPTGNPQKIMASLRRLAELDGDYDIYPGHGPKSRLSWERENNPYMRQEMGANGKTDDFVY